MMKTTKEVHLIIILVVVISGILYQFFCNRKNIKK